MRNRVECAQRDWMKRLFACIGPWMVIAAAVAQEAPRKAEVSYTHYSPAIAWRVGDECFVPPSVLAKWGWTYVFVGPEATLQVEGQTIKVESKTLESRLLVPLTPALKQLGAGFGWKPDKDSFEVYGAVRSLVAKDGTLTIDSTLSTKASIAQKSNPPQVVVEFRGVRKDDQSKIFVDRGTVEELDGNVLRLTVNVDTLPVPPSRIDPARSITLDLGKASDSQPEIPAATTPPKVDAATDEPKVEEPKPPSFESILVRPVEIKSETAKGATVVLSSPEPLKGTPSVRMVDPTTYEILIPGGAYPTDAPAISSDSISGVVAEQIGENSRLTLRLTRPMGVEVSASATGMTLNLIKPAVGNGKLAGKVVVVDAGHGGYDSGAQSTDKKVMEKTLALSMALKLSNLLVAEGATVILTRKTDVYLTVRERPELANKSNADLFISVHANSNKVAGSRSGSMTFYHKASPVGKVLADCIQCEVAKLKPHPSLGARSDGTLYKEGLGVLRLSKMPAVLLEVGFLNHATDKKTMLDSSFQENYMKAVVRGLKVYLGEVKP